MQNTPSRGHADRIRVMRREVDKLSVSVLSRKERARGCEKLPIKAAGHGHSEPSRERRPGRGCGVVGPAKAAR
jgi:hypothetical protein